MKIAEPRPDRNINVVAFTVSEKSSNICVIKRWTLVVYFKTECMYACMNVIYFLMSTNQKLMLPTFVHSRADSVHLDETIGLILQSSKSYILV